MQSETEDKSDKQRSNVEQEGNADFVINPTVEVVIPTLNEVDAIEEVLQGVVKYADRILVIDGNSVDGTAEVAGKLGVRVIRQSGAGKGSALREAFDHVDGDIIVMMDADGSMKPREVPSFVRAMTSGVDLVKGSRFLTGGYSEDITFIRKIGNLLFTSLVNLLWSTRYTDLCYGFGAIRREALQKLYPHLESVNFEIEAEIYIKAKKFGLKVVEIPSVELKRRHGKSNLHIVRDGLRILTTIISEFVA